MREILYTPDTLDLFRIIKEQIPNEVLFDFVEVVFVFDKFHILALPDSLEADSQNKFDEAIPLIFSMQESAHVPSGKMSLLCKNLSIEKIWIMRTLLYFTDYTEFQSKDEALAGYPIPENDLQRDIYDLIGESTGGYNELVTNPNSEEAGMVKKEFANLVDKGILFQTTNSQIFGCYAPQNSYSVECKKIEEYMFQEEITPYYELIEVV